MPACTPLLLLLLVQLPRRVVACWPTRPRCNSIQATQVEGPLTLKAKKLNIAKGPLNLRNAKPRPDRSPRFLCRLTPPCYCYNYSCPQGLLCADLHAPADLEPANPER